MADLDSLSGRMLGEFVLRERIDEGGFGAVYRCEQPLLGREAVVKVLHQRMRRIDIALQRFSREALLASRLDHPYAAHVYAAGVEDDGLLWIAMELVQGITLNRWLHERGPLPLDQLVPFLERLAEVVHAAHERGIVHRDLKPSNVMVIERAGQLLPKLLDFGVARLLDDVALPTPPTWPAALAAGPEPSPDDAPAADPGKTNDIRKRAAAAAPRGPDRLTSTSAMIGSPPYMAPEQWTNPTAVGPPADLYALGIIAYEALTGRRPFEAKTSEEYGALHRDMPVPLLGGRLPADLDKVFQRALAKRPEDRFASALEIAREFSSVLRRELEAKMLTRLRTAAQQWQDRGRPAKLLWRDNMLAELEQWRRDSSGIGMTSRLELEFATASSDLAAAELEAKRAELEAKRRLRFVLAVLIAVFMLASAATVIGLLLWSTGKKLRAERAEEEAERAAVQAKQEASEAKLTIAELEQGRAALLHGEMSDAQLHLAEAYRRGDHSPATTFMLSRALQPRMAELARLASSSGRMWSALFSPDGRRIVTTDDAGARVWDAQSNRLLLTLLHGDIVYQAVYSSDGARIVTAGSDGTVRIWDASNGAQLRELTYPRQRASQWHYFALAMSSDGRLVAAIDNLGKIAHVWNAITGARLAELPSDGSENPAIAFSADNRWFATSGGDNVRVFDTTTWAKALTLAGPRVRDLSFDPTGPRLVTGTLGGDASIWEIPSGRRVRRLREGGEPVDAVAFSPSGELVVTAARDGSEQVWDVASGAVRSQLNHHRGKIQSLEFDASSKLVLAAGVNGTVVVSDAAQGILVSVLEGPSNVVRVAHFDPSSSRIVGASWDGTARLWDATSPYRRWGSPPISAECDTVESLEPDRRFIALSCRGHGTHVWDTARDEQLAELPEVTTVDGDFYSAFPALSAVGDRAAIARGNTVEVYSLPGGKLIRTIVHSAAVNAVAFAPGGHDLVSGAVDGSLLVTHDDREPIALPMCPGGIDAAGILADGRVVVADASRHLRFYSVDGSAVLAELTTPTRVRSLRASPDARRLLTIPIRTKPASPALWDLERYRLVVELDGHHGRVFSARFVRDADEILTAGNDGTARLWDGTTGHLRRTFLVDPPFLFDAALSPDGSMVVTGGGDGLLRFWDTATGRGLWTLQAHRSYVIGIHFEGADIVTRGFIGDVSRWALPKSPSSTVLEPLARCLSSRLGEATRSSEEHRSCDVSERPR